MSFENFFGNSKKPKKKKSAKIPKSKMNQDIHMKHKPTVLTRPRFPIKKPRFIYVVHIWDKDQNQVFPRSFNTLEEAVKVIHYFRGLGRLVKGPYRTVRKNQT